MGFVGRKILEGRRASPAADQSLAASVHSTTGAAFVESIVTRAAVTHASDLCLSRTATSPAIASAANAGGAGSGGPLSRFCDQLRHPPMFREMP
jgi:hypothetical protein